MHTASFKTQDKKTTDSLEFFHSDPLFSPWTRNAAYCVVWRTHIGAGLSLLGICEAVDSFMVNKIEKIICICFPTAILHFDFHIMTLLFI